MYESYRLLKQQGQDISDISQDLVVSTLRKLVFFLGIVFCLVWMFAGMSEISERIAQYLSLPFLMILLSSTVLAWSPYRPLVALILWLAGLFIIITIAVIFFPTSVFYYFYFPLSFIALLLIGWKAGILMELMILAAFIAFSQLHLIPFRSAQSITTLLISFFLASLGWASFDTFNSVTHWACFYYREAIDRLVEARKKQVDLFEVEDDLMKANQELARLTERLKILQLLADEARMAKVQFVANVSHELRAPLNMIIGYSELITRSDRTYGRRLPAPLLADITTIQRNAQHLSRLVDDVLDLSQIETDRMSLSKEKTSFNQIVDTAVEVIRPLFVSKGLYLHLAVPPDLEPIMCDPIRIRQILINLLSNSGRFTQQGGVTITVEQTPNEIICHVADTGPGISKENQVSLFEPFQQVDSSIRREHGGSGLGLTISKKFIEMHDGRIWLESEEGQGTTISFCLPLPIQSDIDVGFSSAASRWVGEYSVREARDRPFRPNVTKPLPYYVLVEAGNTLKRIFSRYPEDVDVISFTRVEDALEKISVVPAQAVIINTPKVLSSVEAVQLANPFSELPYETPVITCWVPGQDDMGRNFGVVDFINKPINIDDLLAAIQKVEPPVCSILVIDDEENVLQMMMRILLAAPANYRVWRASTADEALEVMRTRQPDLVLLDLVMPEKDDWYVLREKSADETIRAIPTMIVSSRDESYQNVTANVLMVNRKSGLSAREFTEFIQAVSKVLTPHAHFVEEKT